MSEQVNESISALMDDEANELDVRRLLNSAAESKAPQEQMRRYQLVRSTLQDAGAANLQLDLSATIAAAIDAEATPSATPAWLKPISGIAVAASVAAIVVVGSQSLLGTKVGVEQESAPQFAQSSPVTTQSLTSDVNVRSVADGVNTTAASQDYQRQLLAQQQRRMNAYMQIHARHASMNGNLGAVPLARAADFQVR